MYVCMYFLHIANKLHIMSRESTENQHGIWIVLLMFWCRSAFFFITWHSWALTWFFHKVCFDSAHTLHRTTICPCGEVGWGREQAGTDMCIYRRQSCSIGEVSRHTSLNRANYRFDLSYTCEYIATVNSFKHQSTLLSAPLINSLQRDMNWFDMNNSQRSLSLAVCL